MSGEDKRRSERVIPFVSDDGIVVVHPDGGKTILAKMLDLSEVGTLIYLLADAAPGALEGLCSLSMYHDRKVFKVPGTIVRRNGRLVAFQFTNPPEEALHDIQAKLIRMEIEWMRLSSAK